MGFSLVPARLVGPTSLVLARLVGLASILGIDIFIYYDKSIFLIIIFDLLTPPSQQKN